MGARAHPAGLLALAVAVGAAAVPGAGVAQAAPRLARSVTVTPVGTLTYTWAGDPARGCAAIGVCGVEGTLTVRVGNSAMGGGPGMPPIELSDQSAVARVVETGSDGAVQRACADPEQVDFTLRLTSSRGRRAVSAPLASVAPPSAGRCAGPLGSELEQLALPARSLGSRGYDLSGSQSFAAGPFAVRVTSRLRILLSRSAIPFPPTRVTPPRPPKSHFVLVETAAVRYRIAAVSGTLGAAFTGAPEPFCQALGTCSVQGSLSLTPQPPPFVLAFSGVRTVRRRVGRARALADLRVGRLQVSDNSFGRSFPATLAGALQSPGTTPCQDSVPTTVPLTSQIAHGQDRLRLAQGFAFAFPGFGGPLRTHCPGPLGSDLVGTGSLASGDLAITRLGDRRLTVTLAAGGAFAGGGYQGTRSGRLVLSLVRVGASGGTRRVRRFGA